jgi:hypothetical protein
MKSKATIICQTLSRSITETGRIGQHHIYIEIDEFRTLVDVHLHVGVFMVDWANIVSELGDGKQYNSLNSHP